jgi:hypothetical protein
MGEKKELREELALTRRTADQLERENELLRQQIAESGAAPPFRMITDAPPTPVRLQIAIKLGIDPVSYQGVGLTDEMILEAVERLRNPHLEGHDGYGDALVVTKADSLAEAVAHNRRERSTLESGLSMSRNIVGRIAGALNVGQWNPDGDEIVEKAQRFGVFQHWLRKRLREHEASQQNTDLHGEALANEIRLVLVALIGEKTLAKLLQNKPIKVSKTMLEIAETPAPTGNTYLDRPFDAEDVLWIRDALKKVAGLNSHRVDQLMLVFERIQKSAAATEEFLAFMNALVLPTLRKQHPAYVTVPKEN